MVIRGYMTLVTSLFIFNINNLLNCNKSPRPHPSQVESENSEMLSLKPIKGTELEECKKRTKLGWYFRESNDHKRRLLGSIFILSSF